MRTMSFWLSEGWEFVKSDSVGSPLYWKKRDDQWFEYSLAGWKELNLSQPVKHVSFFEASAFAKFKGQRLPTEFEWELVCREAQEGIGLPILATPSSRSALNLWQWDGHLTTHLTLDIRGMTMLATNTTASSCARKKCCAVGLMQQRLITIAQLIEISFILINDGNSQR